METDFEAAQGVAPEFVGGAGGGEVVSRAQSCAVRAQMALSQALGDGGDGFAAEVVDADMGDVGVKVFVFGLRISPIVRQADEVEVRAGTQAAHGAPGQPADLPGFAGFHGKPASAQECRLAANRGFRPIFKF